MQTDTERIGDTDYVCQLKWNLPHTCSDTRGKGTTSRGSAQTPEEDWCALPNKDAPTGHLEYDFSHIPYSNTPEGPAFIRQPLEGEH